MPPPVGFPAASSELWTNALPLSCGRKCHSFGKKKSSSNALTAVPKKIKVKWELKRRNGPHILVKYGAKNGNIGKKTFSS